MSIKKALFCLAISLFLVAGFTAHAASADNRYFVRSTSQLWQKTFQARNVLADGFTANLNDWQLKLAKVFGLDVQPVKTLNILSAAPTPTPLVVKKAVAKPANPKVPTDQVAWGVKQIYGDTLTGKDMPSGGASVSVAVLDTGVSKTHPDLKTRITGCADFSTFPAFVDGKCDDANGHGTHVAGIIAADGGSNGAGIYGVAPSADVLAYKVCSNDGTCFADDVAAGIRYAVDQGANIIVLGLGSDSISPLIDSALDYAVAHNVLVIAAAGNDGSYPGSIDYPASNAATVSVAALDAAGNISDWSARGTNSDSKLHLREAGDVELAAPGVNVQSTWNNKDYSTLSGTSMAAAHIAGLAAKEWQKDADNPAEATRDLLHQFSQDIPPTGDDNASGWGMPQL